MAKRIQGASKEMDRAIRAKCRADDMVKKIGEQLKELRRERKYWKERYLAGIKKIGEIATREADAKIQRKGA